MNDCNANARQRLRPILIVLRQFGGAPVARRATEPARLSTGSGTTARLAFRVSVLLVMAVPSWLCAQEPSDDTADVRFSRHIVPLFSRLGCNAGTCHGAVKGKNGFRLMLFGADPVGDHDSLLHEFGGRRINASAPEASLLLLKSTGRVPHVGGKRIEPESREYALLRDWIARGAVLDKIEDSRVVKLEIAPRHTVVKPGERYDLRIDATFADGSTDNVTRLCTFDPRDSSVVEVDPNGGVSAVGVGDTAIVVRYRSEPVISLVIVPGESTKPFPQLAEHNFIDGHVVAKLRQLGMAPAETCDDVTFLRRASLDIAAELPTPDEIRAFVTDKDPQKRSKKIDELLKRPGHAALWATLFCDLLKPQFREDNRVFDEAAYQRRFYEWIRARLAENTPYDQFVERIITATSDEGRSDDQVAAELESLATEDATLSNDLSTYSKRQTLDMFWLRARADGVYGATQFAHAFLGLRLRCAQCHRHPSDVWQQDDLMSLANFFNQVKKVDQYKVSQDEKKKLDAEVKKLTEQANKLRNGEGKKARDEANRLRGQREQVEREVTEFENRAKSLAKSKPDEAEKLTKQAAELRDGKLRALQQQEQAAAAEADRIDGKVKELQTQAAQRRKFAYLKHHFTGVHHGDQQRTISFDTPLGRVQSREFRLLGQREPVEVKPEQDPRQIVMQWLRQPDNPFFARAIVNRVWAHYFGRGIVDPPDDLSPLNPPSHPELLDELCRGFIDNKYDLRWLHRTIAGSRTYQQSSSPSISASSAAARNYAYFSVRRLRAELIVDAINHATGATDEFPENAFLPRGTKAIEVPGAAIYPAGGGSTRPAAMQYAFEIFGRPQRDVEIQCDCETRSDLSLVQSLYVASYENVLDKVSNKDSRPLSIAAATDDKSRCVEDAYLWTLARLPTEDERQAMVKHVTASASAEEGMKDIFWVLMNTNEFLLQH